MFFPCSKGFSNPTKPQAASRVTRGGLLPIWSPTNSSRPGSDATVNWENLGSLRYLSGEVEPRTTGFAITDRNPSLGLGDVWMCFFPHWHQPFPRHKTGWNMLIHDGTKMKHDGTMSTMTNVLIMRHDGKKQLYDDGEMTETWWTLLMNKWWKLKI